MCPCFRFIYINRYAWRSNLKENDKRCVCKRVRKRERKREREREREREEEEREKRRKKLNGLIAEPFL